MEILFEDNHILIINKAPSEIVQSDKTGDISLEDKLKDYIKKKYNKPGNVFLGVSHRVDRPVSGIVMFAKTSKALSRLNEMFKNKEIKKIYWAIVKNAPPKQEDTLTSFIRRDEKKNKSYSYPSEVKGSKKAILDYSVLSKSDNYYLLEVLLHTGRHHQIRCQLANAGCPIKGDLKYGFPRSNKDASISLHARKIEFLHPVTKETVSVIAEPPSSEKLWQFFMNLL
jgi:23S rRNA pseudouridine1911/1915/1917 synthase